MKLFFNENGEVDIAGLNSKTNVSDFFNAIDSFATVHPLPCKGCIKNCCDQQFFIEMDSISTKILSGGNIENYIANNLKIVHPNEWSIQIFLSRNMDRCRYLNYEGGCSIYDNRPATCRFYTCNPKSLNYSILSKVVALALQKELIAMYFEILINSVDPSNKFVEWFKEKLEVLKKSPAHRKENYKDIPVKECIRFDMDGREVSGEELTAYNLLNSMEEN